MKITNQKGYQVSPSPESEARNEVKNNHPFARKLGRITAVCAIISSFAYVTGRYLIDYAIDNGSEGVGQEVKPAIDDASDGVGLIIQEEVRAAKDELMILVDENFAEFEDNLIERILNGELSEPTETTTSTTAPTTTTIVD